MTQLIVVPVIGPSTIGSALSNGTVSTSIATQNFLQSLVGGSSNTNLTSAQTTSYVQQLVGLASNANQTNVLLAGLNSFVFQSIG